MIVPEKSHQNLSDSALSQLTISRPPLLSFDPTFSFDPKDAQCAETNKKHFSDLIIRVIVKIHRKLTIFRIKMTKNDHNSKNKNRTNLKFDVSFDSADSGSFM